MLLVHVLYHLLAVGKILSQEVHGIPQVVRAPVLPVLDNTIQWHLQLAVLINNALGFGSALIALFRLPETICPQWEHRYIATQEAHLCNHTIGRTTIHKVIVDHITSLRGKRHAACIIVELGGGVVIPIQAPTLDALDHVLEVLQIALLHAFVLATTVHLAVLNGAQTVDGLAFIKRKGLVEWGKRVRLFA